MKLFVFYTSCFFAFVAGHMVNYTAILYGLAKFDSSLLAGLAYGFCFGPPILFGWIAGAYIDRYSPKRVLLIAQNFFILGALGMLCVMIYEPIYSVLLFLLSCFFVGIGWAFVAPARLSSMGSYVTGDKLTQATITFNLLIMLGFGLAPIIITHVQQWLDWQGVALLCIVMFCVSSVLLFNAPNHHKRMSHERLKQEWFECFDALKKVPVIPQLLIAAIIGYLMMGPMQVLLPQIADTQLGLNPQEKGQYLGLIAFSLILGGVMAMKLKKYVPIGHTILVLLLMCGVSLILIGVISNVWFSCLVLILGTISAGVVVSFIVAGLQHFTPVFIRGRVMSIYTIISQVISAMAGVLAGAIAQGLNVPSSLFVIGALFIIATLLLMVKGKHLVGFRTFN